MYVAKLGLNAAPRATSSNLPYKNVRISCTYVTTLTIRERARRTEHGVRVKIFKKNADVPLRGFSFTLRA